MHLYTSRPLNPAFVLAAASLACAVTHDALAQVQAVAPTYAVVRVDNAPLRCGPGERFYSVAPLGAGSIVILDGEGAGWSRVTYPSTQGAFVRAEDATVDAKVDATTPATLTLAKESRLRAASQVHGYSGSWQVLLDTPLPAGTALTILEPAKEGEAVVAYKVQAPRVARGFVASASIKRATQADIDAFKATGSVLPVIEGAPALIDGAGMSVLPGQADGQADVAQVAPSQDSTTAQTPSIEVVDAAGKVHAQTPVPIVQGAHKPADPVTPDTAMMKGLSAQIAAHEDARPVSGEPTPEDLEAIFQRVYKQPVLNAEVDELIAQYDRVLAATPAENRRRRGALEQRLNLLRVRVDYRRNLRELESKRANLDQSQIELNKKLEEWSANRYYTIVGQLVPSTVYDGKELPQMYRVVSVGGTAQRTLGYIKRTSELDLDKYLNQVVGVVGEAQLDRSLMLNLITPARIDPLRSVTSSEVVPGMNPASTPIQPPTQVPSDGVVPPDPTQIPANGPVVVPPGGQTLEEEILGGN